MNIRRYQKGLLQGSVLGSLLYLIYSNDWKSCIVLGKIVMFADDKNCLSMGKNANTWKESYD